MMRDKKEILNCLEKAIDVDQTINKDKKITQILIVQCELLLDIRELLINLQKYPEDIRQGYPVKYCAFSTLTS